VKGGTQESELPKGDDAVTDHRSQVKRGARRRVRYGTHPGTSLVEILVAMVILLIGIYSIVRLFPTGFTTILYGRHVSQATALARGMVETQRVRAENLPEGVLAINPLNGSAFPMMPVQEELALFQRQGEPPDLRFSDVNKMRRILGEATKIPSPTTESPYSPGMPVSLYTLNYSPISQLPPNQGGLGGVIVYSGNALNRFAYDGPPGVADLQALDVSSYGIDYGTATLYFRPAPAARSYRIEYSFLVSGGPGTFARELSRPGTIFTVGANQSELRLPLPAGARLEPEEERVYRAFDQIAVGDTFSPEDPYQFKLYNAVTGLLGFNPLASSLRPGGASSRGITARIDYDVDDWHIIREDRVVPGSAPHAIKLTLDGILPIGAVDEYQERYDGLIFGNRASTNAQARQSPTPNIDLLVVDLDTGLIIDNSTLHPEDSISETGGDNSNGEINYRDGSVNFNELVRWKLPGTSNLGSADRIAGKRVRIYYRTPQNWALQMTKAFDEYVREPNLVDLGYREFGMDPPGSGILYFPIQDHDHTVLVDYTWDHRVNGQVIKRTEIGEYHQISDPEDPTSPQNRLGARLPYWWVVLDAAQRSALDPNSQDGLVPGSIRIQRVRGVSVRARAIWREGERWRKYDLYSYVSRDRGA
jgi:hypothetical protein